MDTAARMPMFRALHKDDCVAESALDRRSSENCSATLLETERLSFEVKPKEPGTEYRIQIGDISPADPVGKGFRRHVEWPSDIYLESARGLVDVRLLSRAEDSLNDPWVLRATLLVAVVSAKVTEEVFEAMVQDLTALSSGLLFDLVSKSFAGITKGQTRSNVKISPRSAQLELHFLEKLVQDIGLTLLEISRQPETALRPVRVVAAWTGSERLSNDGLSWFVARGIDPRESRFGHGLVGPQLNFVAELNCVEHGVIRWFLELVRERLVECAKRANAEQSSLESDKVYRSHRFGNESSLYEQWDLPKIKKLKVAISRARRIDRAIRGMLMLPFLSNQRPLQPRELTPVFQYVLHYHKFWHLMREYLRRSTLLLEHNLDERNKPTWRMYEQWVFLQMAAACEDIGLRPSSHESLFRRLGAHLFTVDLRRGTRLGFTSADGRIIILRYEPWIFSRDLARRNGDTLFQGRDGESAWSPDVLMEIFEPTVKGMPARIALAIVIDAKYTKRIEEHHWESTGKYQMIRETESGTQIVRQVWVASPVGLEDGEVVMFRDPTVSWSSAGPDRPVSASEFLQGAVSLVPDPISPRGSVCPAAREFLEGLLTWLQFPEAKARRF